MFTKLNMYLACNPAIAPWGIYPRELITYIHTKTCTQMVAAALLVVTLYFFVGAVITKCQKLGGLNNG